MRLGAHASPSQAQLDGFKSRELRSCDHQSDQSGRVRATQEHPLILYAHVYGTETLIYQQPLQGSLYELTCDHVINDTFIFPSAAYLELFNAVSLDSKSKVHVLSDGIFQSPLTQELGIYVECELNALLSFEVHPC